MSEGGGIGGGCRLGHQHRLILSRGQQVGEVRIIR